MNTTTPFSEAIRLGGTLGPQCLGALAKYVDSAQPRQDGGAVEVLHTCAFGGALLAMGVPVKQLVNNIYPDSVSEDLWPSIELTVGKCSLCPPSTPSAPCTECGMVHSSPGYSVGGLVTHLNDYHQLTRDEIADLVKQYDEEVAERQPATATEPRQYEPRQYELVT